ncbi:MAG: hypothetical protein IJV89_00920 [Lentisphaeria bacterium]|nr:hypothetical protein [Lentisphaeria bacterium]
MNAKRKIDPGLLLAWGICGVLLLTVAAIMPRHGYWITDGGNKFMVMENILQHRSIAMQNPASALDPANRFFPDAVFHFQKTPQGIFSVFPPFFSILTAPFYHFCGHPGKYILPLLGGIASLYLLLHFMTRWHMRHPLLLSAAAFATPLAFYTVEFWEMAPGILPVLGMLYLLQKKKDLWGGLVLATGLWIRPEMFFFAAAAGGALLLTDPRRTGKFAAGFLAGSLPYGATQYLLSGHITGIHGATYIHTARRIFWNYYYYFFSCKPAGLAAGIAAFLLGCAPGFKSFILLKRIFAVIIAAGSLYFLKKLLQDPQPVDGCIMTIGLFTTTPFLYLTAANWRSLWNAPAGSVRITARITLIYTAILPMFLTSSDLGIIWGARHWLFLLPVMVLLAWYTARSRTLRKTLLLLFLLSTLIQFHGLQTQYIMRKNSCRLTDFLRENTRDIIVSDVFFLPMQTPELFRERRWLFVKNDQELLDVIRLLQQEKRPFALVRSCHGNYRRVSNRALAELLKIYRVPEKPQAVKLHKTAFLEVEIFQLVPR